MVSSGGHVPPRPPLWSDTVMSVTSERMCTKGLKTSAKIQLIIYTAILCVLTAESEGFRSSPRGIRFNPLPASVFINPMNMK